ncbi:hypothetical protein AAC387_Pa01g1237 [Persea americana]
MMLSPPMLLPVINDPLQLQIIVDDAITIDVCSSHCLFCFPAGKLHANALQGPFQFCSAYHPISIWCPCHQATSRIPSLSSSSQVSYSGRSHCLSSEEVMDF